MEEMAHVKRMVGKTEPIIERIRAYSNLEGKDQDFNIQVNFNECLVKPFGKKAEKLKASELGVIVYGRNLAMQDGSIHPAVKEALKCSRSHLTEKKTMRTSESVTEDEIQQLEQQFLGVDLPEDGDWIYTGYCYINQLGSQKKSY